MTLLTSTNSHRVPQGPQLDVQWEGLPRGQGGQMGRANGCSICPGVWGLEQEEPSLNTKRITEKRE